ncbi:MAG: DUF58 domain-containing protein [Oscillospiraceae bacterium]|nr:DUF58 domain-containing protein [Oscillospiraceae bacterium]
MIIFIAFGVITAVIIIQRILYIKFAFTNLKISYRFSSGEVNEGDIFFITEEIENKKYLPLPSVSTLIDAGAGIAFANGAGEILEQNCVFSFSTVGIYKKITRSWRIKAVKRGRFNINDVTVTIKDIFGLVTIVKDFSCETSVLILPSPFNKDEKIDVPNFTGGAQPVMAGYYSDPFNIVKISEYTYSEPLNKINWKASAKSQTLMVNYEQPSVSARILVVLDSSEAPYLFERNIKLCATLPYVIPDDSEITFAANSVMPENYINPLIRFIDNSSEDLKFANMQTKEFTLGSHNINFRRILAEILSGSEYDAEKLTETSAEQAFYNTILLVKGGKINDYYEYKNNKNI